MMASFALLKLFSFMRTRLTIVDLSAHANGVLFERFFLCQWVQSYSPFFFPLGSMYLVLCWSLWSIWSWVLCRVINTDLFAFFYLKTSSLTSTSFWRCYLFFQYVFCFHQQSGVHSCEDLRQCVCFCANTTFYLYYYSSVVQLEIGNGDTSRGSFIIQDCF